MDRGNDLDPIGKREHQLDIPLEFFLEGRSGEVVRIVHFGNIITNIPPLDKSEYMSKHNIMEQFLTLCETCELDADDDVFVVVESSDTLELSTKKACATDYIGLRVGDRITLE